MLKHWLLFLVQAIGLFFFQAFGIIAGLFIVPLMLATGKFDPESAKHFTQYNTNRTWIREVFSKFYWPWDNLEDSSTGDGRGWWDLETGDSRKWLSRFRWLAIRNPFNNAKRYVIGIDMRKYFVEVLQGQLHVRDSIGSQGFQFLRADAIENGMSRYMLYWVRSYKDREFTLRLFKWKRTLTIKNRAIVVQIGNKIKVEHNNKIEADEYDYFKGFTMEINPFKDIG